MNNKTVLYIAVVAGAIYLYRRLQNGEMVTLSGHKVVDTIMPWMNIRNPIVSELVKRAGYGFMNNFASETMGDVMDAEFIRVD